MENYWKAFGHDVHSVVPYGLANVSAPCYIINNALCDMLGKFIAKYPDDITVYSSFVENQLEHGK